MRGAVVGVGYLGTFHAQKYKALAQELNFEFVGVCDAHEPQAKKVAHDLKVASFNRPDELIGKVDFVTISTSTPFHFEIAKLFLNNGVHVNVEKPMTVTAGEAEELIGLANKNSLKLAVGHSERFAPLFSAMRGSSKVPQYLELQRHAPYKSRGAEVSVILDLMIHDLDLMLAMDSSKPTLVGAAHGCLVSPSPDWAIADFQFASGLHAHISVSRVASVMSRSLKIVENGLVQIGNFQTGELEVGRLSSDNQFLPQYISPAPGKGDNLLLETRNFIKSIQGNETLVVDGTAGLRALALAEEVFKKGLK
jgi:predicted dehydrogenase